MNDAERAQKQKTIRQARKRMQRSTNHRNSYNNRVLFRNSPPLSLNMLKGFDQYASTPLSLTNATSLGGIVSLSTYIILAAYLGYYITSNLQSSFPTELHTVVFPQKSSVDRIALPKLHCVAESGCWYRPFNFGPTPPDDRRRLADPPPNPPPDGGAPTPPTPPNEGGGDDSQKCYYIPLGETIPTAHLDIAHDSDPIDSFTGIWKGSNFGFSYDVTEVIKTGPSIESKTFVGVKSLTDASVSGDPRFLLYKGKSLFNLVRTIGVQGEADVVDTWTNTVAAEDGTPDVSQNICCFAPTVVHGITGVTLSADEFVMRRGDDMNPTSLCSNTDTPSGDSDEVIQVKIRPFPSYSSIQVLNPLNLLTLWSVIGGALAIIELFVGFVGNHVPREDEEITLKRFGLGNAPPKARFGGGDNDL
jgi:hypothetical protein